MTGLLLRVHAWSWKNRIRTRLRRLRQVRYLVFTGLAVAWVLFFWQPWRTVGFLSERTDGGIRIGADAIPPEFAPVAQAGLALLQELATEVRAYDGEVLLDESGRPDMASVTLGEIPRLLGELLADKVGAALNE